jgi:hypothetical protein
MATLTVLEFPTVDGAEYYPCSPIPCTSSGVIFRWRQMIRKKQVAQGRAIKKTPVKKHHGTLLKIALIIMVVHGIFDAYLFYSLKVDPDVQRPWILGLMVVHFLANILAVDGIFY